MYIVESKPSRSPKYNREVSQFSECVSEAYLENIVEKVSVPRHRFAEAKNNCMVANYIETEFKSYGLNVHRQGDCENIVAGFLQNIEDAKFIIGAHYDSVPGSPGADDNGSAVAGMLAAARALSLAGKPPVAFIAFNQEEDGLLGSREFVNEVVKGKTHQIKQVHILEMIGYCDHTSGSQSLPAGLPIKISDKGDFLAILANRDSNKLISPLLQAAGTYLPDLPVKVLKIFLGVERFFPHLLRSDHSPFWEERIPAFMWTDTSEFRNPNYHKHSDTPETLDYQFLLKVTRLLISHVVESLDLKVQQ